MMQKVLITGSNGQLGNEIRVLSKQYPEFDFIFTDVDELDITNRDALTAFFEEHLPGIIINCAAYTAVDKAEDDRDNAFKINEYAVGLLGEMAQRFGARMIHVSTDYVFDGKSYQPYSEEMPVNPSTVYGQSKQAGDALLMQVCPQAAIVRTSWLYSSFGNNFVKTMRRLAAEREQLTVIFDQVGTPTYAADLAEALLIMAKSTDFMPGLYHFSNEGVCSWYDFALKIIVLSGLNCKVLPIESKDFPVRTPRPFYSVLNKQKVKKQYDLQIAHWEDGLKRCLDKLQ
jgi:dTDP-4-dehydrorhamnose reductase